MVGMEDLTKSLNLNPNLTEDLRNDFLELIIIFNKQFPNVDLTNLAKRLETVVIERGSKFLIKGTSKYDPINNILMYNLEGVREADGKYIMMRSLLNMVTAKEDFIGFNVNNKFEALNIGLTEIIANYLVSNNNEYFEYADEIVATNMVADVVGIDTLIDAYFTNNANLILENV